MGEMTVEEIHAPGRKEKFDLVSRLEFCPQGCEEIKSAIWSLRKWAVARGYDAKLSPKRIEVYNSEGDKVINLHKHIFIGWCGYDNPDDPFVQEMYSSNLMSYPEEVELDLDSQDPVISKFSLWVIKSDLERYYPFIGMSSI